jgi:hypothetical protein
MTTEEQNNEPDKVVEVITGQPAAEEVIKPWTTVDDTPEVHPSFLDQPKVEEIEKVVKEVVIPENVPTNIDDESVIKYLKEKGFNTESLEDLKPKEIANLDSETEKYLEYKKETGRGYNDFLETQKDWSAESKENILLQNLRLENPTLTDKQIDRLYEKEYVTSEFADDDEITDKEINIERDYQKGLKLLESQKEKYKSIKGLDESIPEDFVKAKEFADSFVKQQEENKIAFEQTAKDFQSKTDEVFSSNFEGFKVKVGDEEFSIKPENVQETKKTLSDLSNFDKKFFDESGKLKDPQGYYKALHFAMNPDKVADHFIKIGMAKQLEIEEKESKNIIVDGVKNIQTGSPVKRWNIVEES